MKQYKEILLELQSKMEQIAKFSRPDGNGEDFVGIQFSKEGINYITKTYYSGCGDELYELFVEWDELNEPMSYFEEKFKKEWEEYIKTQKQLARMEKEQKIENRRKLFLRLKQEFDK